MKNKLIKTIFVFVFMFIGVCNVKAEKLYCKYTINSSLLESNNYPEIVVTYTDGKGKVTSSRSDEYSISINGDFLNINNMEKEKDKDNDCPKIWVVVDNVTYNEDDPRIPITLYESRNTGDANTQSISGVEFGNENEVDLGQDLYCSYDFGEDILAIKYNKKAVNYYYAKNQYNTTSLDTKFSGYAETEIKNNFGTSQIYYPSGRDCPKIYYNYSSDSIEVCNENNNDSVCHATSSISGKKIDSVDFYEIKNKKKGNTTVGDKAECTYYEGDYFITIKFSVSGDGQLKQVKIASDSDIKVTGSISEITNEFGTLSTPLDPREDKGGSCPEICSYYTDESNTSIAIKKKENSIKKCSEIYGDGKDYTKLTGKPTSIFDKIGPTDNWKNLLPPIFEEIVTGGEVSCEEMLGEKGVDLLRGAFLLIKIAAPILFVVLSMIDFFSSLTSDDTDTTRNKAFSNMKTRAICCALLYCLPLLIKLAFKIIGVIDTDTCGVW